MSGRRADISISEAPAETSPPLSSGERETQLTSRERQILALFALGLGTTAIAGRLSISTTTVRNHSQRILAKLGVHSRLHAVAVGYANGLIPVPMPSFRPREER